MGCNVFMGKLTHITSITYFQEEKLISVSNEVFIWFLQDFRWHFLNECMFSFESPESSEIFSCFGVTNSASGIELACWPLYRGQSKVFAFCICIGTF